MVALKVFVVPAVMEIRAMARQCSEGPVMS
jgi:hypothetical protein